MAFLLSRRHFLQGTLGPMGCLALDACGSSSVKQSIDSSSAGATPVTAVNRGPTTDTALFTVQSTDLASIADRPEAFFNVYQALAPGGLPASVMRQKLGSQFTTLEDSGCLATFASVVSFNVAPAGDTSITPFAATLDQLVNATALTCGHYCKLTTLFALLQYPLLIPPDAAAGQDAKATIHFVVWNADVPLNTGIHSQLILSNVMNGAYLLLDPLYGIALRIPYGSGYPQAGLSVIENAVSLLSTPLDSSNLVVLDPRGIATNPDITPTLLGGRLSPSYIYHDALYGSEGWDIHVSQTLRLMS